MWPLPCWCTIRGHVYRRQKYWAHTSSTLTEGLLAYIQNLMAIASYCCGTRTWRLGVPGESRYIRVLLGCGPDCSAVWSIVSSSGHSHYPSPGDSHAVHVTSVLDRTVNWRLHTNFNTEKCLKSRYCRITGLACRVHYWLDGCFKNALTVRRYCSIRCRTQARRLPSLRPRRSSEHSRSIWIDSAHAPGSAWPCMG